MINKNENINTWILGRGFMILFFLIVLSFSNKDANAHTQVDPGSLSVERTASIDNTAIIYKPLSISSCCEQTLSSSGLLFKYKIHDSKFNPWIANNITRHILSREKYLYINFKVQITEPCLMHLKLSSDEELPLIS